MSHAHEIIEFEGVSTFHDLDGAPEELEGDIQEEKEEDEEDLDDHYTIFYFRHH